MYVDIMGRGSLVFLYVRGYDGGGGGDLYSYARG
jgi:hypothetical protein